MTQLSFAEQAERLSRRRARMLPILAVVYLGQQASFFATLPDGPDRAVDHLKIGAWVVLSLVLLAGLATKGFWLRPRQVRDLIDDEGTRANRLAALGWGFTAALLGAIVLYVVSLVSPMGAREAIHIIVSLGIGVALVRFGALERRAFRDA